MGVTTVIKDYGTEILDAIRQNNLPRLQLILEKQLKYDSKIAKLCVTDIKHKPSKKFASPLILAARQENPQILHYMMEKGTDPNFIHHTIYSSKRREIVTALHIAVDLGYYENVEVLLSVNADCNIGDHNQETPLHIAVKKADCTMTRMLLSKGADPTIPDRYGNGALHIATLYGHLQLVKEILKHDADIFQKGQFDAIPPHIAAKEGHIHLIDLFYGRFLGNINIKIPCYADGREKAPLHLSAENGHHELVQALLEKYEAEVNLKDSDGNTPLHCCVLNPYDPHRLREKEDYTETARILLRHRVSVNSKNAFGDSALHLASMNHFQRVVEMLLEVGANPFIENHEKLKPIDVVPDDDPVTRQVLKMAMLQGPRPLMYPSMDSNLDQDKDISSSQSSGQNSRTQGSGANMHAVGVGLDRSVSMQSSQSTLPSVFGEAGRHPNAPLPAPPATKTSTQGQQTTENEIPLYKKVDKSAKTRAQGTGPGHHRPASESSSIQDDTYSFLSDTTTQDEGTQTMRKPRGKDIGIMAQRDRKMSHNKKLQTSFDLDASITYSTMSSQTDLQSYADLQSINNFSELSIQNIGKHNQHQHSIKPTKDTTKPNAAKRKDKTLEDSYQDDSTIYANESGFRNRKNVPIHPRTGARKESHDDDDDEDDSEFDSDEFDEDESSIAHVSQVIPYSGKKMKEKAYNKNKQASTQDPNLPPGSVRVNSLPGKPGTIELQYSGGPLTIALDTQAFNNNMQLDPQGQYFLDQHGNKYPAGIIQALQQAAGIMGNNKDGGGQGTPIVSAQMGDNVQHIYKTPQRPEKPQEKTLGKPRAPSPREQIYANQEEIAAMMDGSLNTTAGGLASPLKSPPVEIKTIITETVSEATGPLSPGSATGRSTPTVKEQDHLRRILGGRGTPVRRGATPTKQPEPEQQKQPAPEQQRVFNFEQRHMVQENPVESSSEEETESSEEEEESEDDDTEGETGEVGEELLSPPPPPLPDSQPPVVVAAGPRFQQPPQKQPRRSLQNTPTFVETTMAGQKKKKVKSSPKKEPSKALHTSEQIVTEIHEQHDIVMHKKRPEKALIISRADHSFDNDLNGDDNVSPDQWDQTPNASPQHRSFSEKLAWAKALDGGATPGGTPSRQGDAVGAVDTPSKKTKSKKAPQAQERKSKSKKSRPPLSPDYKSSDVAVGDQEYDHQKALPEYVRQTQQDEEEESSEEETDSEEEEETDSESEKSVTTVVTQANEIKMVITTEKVRVITTEQAESSDQRLERLQTEALVMKEDGDGQAESSDQRLEHLQAEALAMKEYSDGPGARRFMRGLSPTGSGRSTPDSIFSDSSAGGRGLNMRVTGPTPKAYTHEEKERKRVEWLKAKPEGIESGSEYSDYEYGSRGSLNRSLSPAAQERARKWSEEIKPVHKKRGPMDSGKPGLSKKPVVQLRGQGKPPNGRIKGENMIGSYAKPYLSFGKIETKTDLLEEAMLSSPMSPMSPTSQEIFTYDQRKLPQMTEYGSEEALEISKNYKNKDDKMKRELRMSPAQFLEETKPEDAEPMDSDEGPNIDSANASIAESSFKKNIKWHDPAPELYEAETVEQPVSIGASVEDLLQAAELAGRKSSSSSIKTSKTVTERTVREGGTLTETVTTTVLSTHTNQPQVGEAVIVNTEDEESFGEDSEEDMAQYEQEPGVRRSKPHPPEKGNVKVEIVETNLDNNKEDDFEQYNNEPGVRRAKKTKQPDSIPLGDNSESKQKSPFEEFTEPPAEKKSKTKKVKKIKKKKKDGESLDDTADMDQSMDIEAHGAEPGSRKPKKKKAKKTTTTTTEVEKPTEVNTTNLDDEFNPDEEVKLYDENSSDILENGRQEMDEYTAAYDQYSAEPGARKPRHMPDEPHSTSTPQQSPTSSNAKQTFEISFGPEDEEVAQINIAADERKKKRKEKKKKIKKQEDVWAEEQKQWHEKQPQLKSQDEQEYQPKSQVQDLTQNEPQGAQNVEPVDLLQSGENVQQQTIVPQDFTQLVSDYQQKPFPAAQITFSDGIKVIDQTNKPRKKSKTDESEDPEKVKKKKKKKEKGEKTTTKKKKKSRGESVESLVDDIETENNLKNIEETATGPTVTTKPQEQITPSQPQDDVNEEYSEYSEEPGVRRSKPQPSSNIPSKVEIVETNIDDDLMDTSDDEDNLEQYGSEPGIRKPAVITKEPGVRRSKPKPSSNRPSQLEIVETNIDDDLMDTSDDEDNLEQYGSEPGIRKPAVITKEPGVRRSKPKPSSNRPSQLEIVETNIDDDLMDTSDDEDNLEKYGSEPGIRKPAVKTNAINKSPKTPDSLGRSEEDLSVGIHSTVMGSKVERSDTVRKAGGMEERPIMVIRRPQISEEVTTDDNDIDEDEESEFTDDDDEYVVLNEDELPPSARQSLTARTGQPDHNPGSGQVGGSPARDPVTGEPVGNRPAPDTVTGEQLGNRPALDPVTGEPVGNRPALDPVTGEPVGGEGGVTYQQVEMTEDTAGREKKLWRQYQKQRQESLEKDKKKSTNAQEIKETDIDADIYETNIDDDIDEQYHTIEETNLDDDEPLPAQSFQRETGVRRSVGRKKRSKRPPAINGQASEQEPRFEFEEDEMLPPDADYTALNKKGGKAPPSSSSIPIHQKPPPSQPQEEEQPHSWTDQRQQAENMKAILQSFQQQNYDTASLDSELYATIEYDNNDPQAQPYRDNKGEIPGGRVPVPHHTQDPRYHSLPAQPTYESQQPSQHSHPYSRQPLRKPKQQNTRTVADVTLARMWSEQHPVPPVGDDPRRHHSMRELGPEPALHDSRQPRRADSKGALSDTDTAGGKRRKKKLKFREDVHSEAELRDLRDLRDLDPLHMARPDKSLQEAAFETLTANLQNQPKLTARKPIESLNSQKPINYTRGVYRPQPVYWRGSRGQPTDSSRYDDSHLMTQMWSEQHPAGEGGATESEEGEENYYLEPINVRRNQPVGISPSSMGETPEYMNDPNGSISSGSQPGAFQPFSPYGPGKRVKIYDEENERRRHRQEREAAFRERKERKKDKAPKTEIGPIDLTKYPTTAKIWMEQVDRKTVQKSKTMYLSVMPEGTKPPPEIENYVPSTNSSGPEDVFLPPQWVIARGRSARPRRRKPTQDSTRESLGSLSGVTSGESDYEADRPMSPGQQVLLFYRCGNNWTDLVWILFQGLLGEDQIRQMIGDIQLKHPRNLTGQVSDFMHRWWRAKGPTATIEELRRALDIASMPYVQEDFFNEPLPSPGGNKGNLSGDDPEVARLIQEFGVRSLNTSYDDGALRGKHGDTRMNMSADNLRLRLASYQEKGTTIDRSRLSHLSASDSVFKRDSNMSYESGDSYDEYGSDYEGGRRAFVIVQPQLKQKDYNYETQI